MKRFFAFAGLVALLSMLAVPAMAGTLEGGCTVDATSDSDSTNVIDATRADPFLIDPAGSVSWVANSPGPITNHTWEVGVVVLGLDVRLFNGGDENSGLSQESKGSKSIPTEVERIDNSQLSWILDNLGGVIEVYGSISGDGGAICSGSGFVSLDVGPLEGLVGQISLATTAAGLALIGLAGVGKAA